MTLSKYAGTESPLFLRRSTLTSTPSNEGQFCSISIDSGTNAGERTLDVNSEQTGENVKSAVEATIKAVLSKLVLAAFVSDNAANMRSSTRLLAATFIAFTTKGCFVHPSYLPIQIQGRNSWASGRRKHNLRHHFNDSKQPGGCVRGRFVSRTLLAQHLLSRCCARRVPPMTSMSAAWTQS